MTTITDSYGHEHQLPGPYKTVAEIKRANRERGHYFFSRDTLRFFDSKIEPYVIHGRLFLTSEQFHGSDGTHGDRIWTIRIAGDDGEVHTYGEFQQYRSAKDAVEAAKALGQVTA